MATFDTEDIRVNGHDDVLEALIPLEHIEAAGNGEWGETSFTYEFNDAWFEVVRYYPPGEENEARSEGKNGNSKT